jgi:hypothetical protein
MRGSMSQRAVEQVLGKMITDEGFRNDFYADPTLASLGIGVALSREEVSALARVSGVALAELARQLDDRICRLHVGHEVIRKES